MKKLFLLTFSLLSFSFLQAQIGVNTEDPKATLDIQASSTGANTPEGVIYPRLTRAQLITKDNAYTLPQTGAMIYVTTIDGVTTAKTARVTVVGYYYFDGSVWQPIDYVPESLYLPSFNLPMTAVANNQTYDIYTNVYRAQFLKAGNATWVSSNASLAQIPVLYPANELDYVVTYFDPSVIKVNSVSAIGVLNYNVLTIDPDNRSFITIVLVPRK